MDALDGVKFSLKRVFVSFQLYRILVSLSKVKMKFDIALFSFIQYATAYDQGLSAETCYASREINLKKYDGVLNVVCEKNKEHHGSPIEIT